MSDNDEKDFWAKELTKFAQSSSTTQSLYISEHGDVFTAADLVQGQGKISGKGGKYKPKKWKGYSLATRVQSESFGKTKK